MPSQYSTSLKIQLMQTGENSTTWGDVTNDNFKFALEEAIVGSADVTFASNNQTLTLTDTNSSQTARNLRLNLTGTTGGSTRTLTVPAVEKVYLINNACGDAIAVQNPTGSNVSVPANKSMWVYSTGSNVVDAVTHLTSLTLGTPLAVAQGGTGSNTGTFSGANITSINANNISSGILAVAQGGTGSSSLTFSGANITAINANSISTGTLAVDRGGTGTTSLTANNVIIGNGTSAVTFVAPGTNGNVLMSNGTAWASTAISGTYALQTTTITGTGGLTGGGSLAANRTISIASNSNGYGTRTVQAVSAGTPTGGSDGDIVYQY